MSAQARPNPFHVLGLTIDAAAADVVHRGRELTQLAETDEDVQLIRWAIQELSTHPLTRVRHELLEVPDTEYREDDWDRFEQQNRKLPVDLDALTAGAEPLRTTDFDLRAVVGLLLDELLSPQATNIRPAVENAPVTPVLGAPPIEVNDVIFG
jgi:hypothetical protein